MEFFLHCGPKPNRPIQKRDSLYATCSHRMRSSLCRKFLNFAFTRIWRGDRIGAQGGRVPGLNIKWYGVFTAFQFKKAIGWQMNTSILTRLSRLPCELSAAIRCSLIGVTEARSSNLFRWYVRGPSRSGPSHFPRVLVATARRAQQHPIRHIFHTLRHHCDAKQRDGVT